MRDRFKDEITLGMFFHFSPVRDVDAELFGEQLDDVFGQFSNLFRRVIAPLAHAVQQNLALEKISRNLYFSIPDLKFTSRDRFMECQNRTSERNPNTVNVRKPNVRISDSAKIRTIDRSNRSCSDFQRSVHSSVRLGFTLTFTHYIYDLSEIQMFEQFLFGFQTF